MAVTVERAIKAETPVRERADGLLHIDPVAWCGGALSAVPIERLVDKALRAALAPDDLEKQIALLATEDEAYRLGLGDLIVDLDVEVARLDTLRHDDAALPYDELPAFMTALRAQDGVAAQ